MDDYLLGENLEGYTTSWRYDELNSAEKCLLGKKDLTIGESVKRWISDRSKVSSRGRGMDNKLFEMIMSESALETM
jgi:hypothetical protein